MRKTQHIPFIVSALLLCAAVYLLYPYYQYYVDPDATGYLTVSRRYVEGDYLAAINGYWSPWSCWLVALMEKYTHLGLMHCAVRVNTWGAIGFLFITHSFLVHFGIRKGLLWAIDLMLAVFLSYAVYGQLFDDLWECFFLLSILRLMLRSDYLRKPWLWVASGLLGALAYFAKAYSFPFFILHTTVVTFVLARAWDKRNRRLWLKVCAVSIGVMVLGSLPWIYALQLKYGEWMTATAGKLNLSWYVVGHGYWKEGITHLVPPPHPDSPYYWEDPYLVNGPTPNFLSSFSMFRLQLIRIPYNLVKMVNCMNQLSLLFLPISAVLLATLASPRVRRLFPSRTEVVALSFLLFPLAFTLMNFEARYIWYMLPLNIVMGALLTQRLLDWPGDSRVIKVAAVALFLFSYLYWPVYEMKAMYRVGEEDARLAAELQKRAGSGSFTALPAPGRQLQGIERVAYFSGMQYYNIPDPTLSHAELLAEMRRYGVKYYVYFRNPSEGEGYRFTNEKGEEMPELMRDDAYGVRVFELTGR
ncbi:MAG: hypothetical protein JNL72_12650 [Flavipsychrobacter sp.]|nr:hypothetical protein [Flavipsychrobacter sp.]